MITASNFNDRGRLGNILFRYASLIGLANKHKTELRLPAWNYSKYFEGDYPQGEIESAVIRDIREVHYHFTSNWPSIDENENVNIDGYLQSPLYWQHCEKEVRGALAFKDEFKAIVGYPFLKAFEKETIGISIRRGDYVNNPNYYNLPITYFIRALFDNFPHWQDCNVIIFSDDIPYCRVHFGCLPNVTFSDNNSNIEDLCLLSQCENLIISNSTFSWWGAYLSNAKTIIRPNHHFAGGLAIANDWKDYYPTNRDWVTYDHIAEDGGAKKIDLKDCSFQIPVKFDHADRKENLDLCIRILQKNFDAEIIISEQGGRHFEYLQEWGCTYLPNDDMAEFHRTKMLNDMASFTEKPIIFNWDADVLIAPLQVWLTAEKLRGAADMCYPYDGQFARMPRNTWFSPIRDYEDIGMVKSTKFNGMNLGDAVSLGGAVAFRRDKFIEGGMENEAFIAYNPEDVERYERFKKLGYSIARVPGPMYHMNHFITPTSSMANPFYSRSELTRIVELTPEDLQKEVKTWEWVKKVVDKVPT